MPEQLEKFLSDLKQILTRMLAFLTPQQKRLIFIGLPVFGALGYAGMFAFEQMNYGPLYTNLAPADGSAVVKELEAAKIPYPSPTAARSSKCRGRAVPDALEARRQRRSGRWRRWL